MDNRLTIVPAVVKTWKVRRNFLKKQVREIIVLARGTYKMAHHCVSKENQLSKKKLELNLHSVYCSVGVAGAGSSWRSLVAFWYSDLAEIGILVLKRWTQLTFTRASCFANSVTVLCSAWVLCRSRPFRASLMASLEVADEKCDAVFTLGLRAVEKSARGTIEGRMFCFWEDCETPL